MYIYVYIYNIHIYILYTYLYICIYIHTHIKRACSFDHQKSESSNRFAAIIYLIVLCKILLFSDVLFFESP